MLIFYCLEWVWKTRFSSFSREYKNDQKKKKNVWNDVVAFACDAVEVEENEYDEIKKYLHSAREIRWWWWWGCKWKWGRKWIYIVREVRGLRVCKKRNFCTIENCPDFLTLFLFHAIVDILFFYVVVLCMLDPIILTLSLQHPFI